MTESLSHIKHKKRYSIVKNLYLLFNNGDEVAQRNLLFQSPARISLWYQLNKKVSFF